MQSRSNLADGELTTFQLWRVPLAFVISPLAGCAVVSALVCLTFGSSRTWTMFLSYLRITAFVAYGATFILAFPTFLYLRRKSRVNLAWCLLIGVVIGALGGGLMGALIGILSSAVFWLIGLRDSRRF